MLTSRFFLVVVFSLFVAVGLFMFSRQSNNPKKEIVQETSSSLRQAISDTPTPTPLELPERYVISPGNFVGQTFNNCGPATLSMAMSVFGINVSQGELASSMRPFNNPLGGVDDKSIFAHEFVKEAKNQGFLALHRPNGTSELMKRFLINDIPVVVRTWLNDYEDIGHFRLVNGYDSSVNTLIYQDSYYGPNQTQSESDFQMLWKPFNYGYILVYPEDKQDVVEEILGENIDEQIAWERSQVRSTEALSDNPSDDFARFNLAVANFYLGNYNQTIEQYEKAQGRLPPRMLWYQPEPIYAYQKNEQYDKAFELTDAILSNGNLAYSELYQVKGEIYIEQGQEDLAREQFEKAIYYNRNFQPAHASLTALMDR